MAQIWSLSELLSTSLVHISQPLHGGLPLPQLSTSVWVLPLLSYFFDPFFPSLGLLTIAPWPPFEKDRPPLTLVPPVFFTQNTPHILNTPNIHKKSKKKLKPMAEKATD
jgi:hypothetical protein